MFYKKVYQLAWIGWLLLALYAIFFMAPSVNDGLYLDQSQAVLQHWIPGTWIGDHLYPVFFDLPTFPFINGLFYKLMSLVGIPLTPYTFRLFAVLCVFLLLFLTVKLIDAFADDQQDHYLLKTLSLALLALTPFVTGCWDVRPEILGLSFLTGSILAYRYKRYRLSGLSLGAAATMHPLIALYALMTGLGYLVNLLSQRRYRSIILLVLMACLSCMPLLLWFLYHKHIAIAQLLYRADAVVAHHPHHFLQGIRFILHYMAPFSAENSLLVNLYYAIFYWMLIPVLLAFFILASRQNWKNIAIKLSLWLPAALMFTNVVIILCVKMYGSYLVNISYTLVLSVLCLLFAQKDSKSINTIIQYIPKSIVLTATLLLVTFSAWAQLSKFTFTNKVYYKANTTRKAVLNHFTPKDVLIITGQRLIPAFANVPRVHCVFCAGAGQLPATLWKHESSEYIYHKLAKKAPSDIIWGVMKQDIQYHKNNEICFELKGFPAPVLLSDGKIVFEDSDNLFYRAKYMWIGQAGEPCSELAALPTLPELR